MNLLTDAKIFTKLDVNSGLGQLPLDESSTCLTNFITPFGRYRFLRLPFGISSAAEHFQRRMSQLLENIPGTICQMDEILVQVKNQSKHYQTLRIVLNRLKDAGITLNNKKCKFSIENEILGTFYSRQRHPPD